MDFISLSYIYKKKTIYQKDNSDESKNAPFRLASERLTFEFVYLAFSTRIQEIFPGGCYGGQLYYKNYINYVINMYI